MRMRTSVTWMLGVGSAWVAGAYWAFALTVLQPPSEPAKPWIDVAASNNTYWVRDLRWTALLIVFLGLVLASRGDRLRSLVAALGTLAWYGLDLWLDRLDVTATVPVALGATVVTLGAGVAARPGPARVGRGSRRGVLLVAASVAAAASPVAVGIESPSDSEAALTPSALGLGALLMVLALGCATAAAPALTRVRLLAAVAAGAVAGAWMVWARAVQPGHRVVPLLVLTALLLTGVALLAWEWPTQRRMWALYALVPTGTLVVYPVVFIMAVMFSLMVAPAVTAMAGNAPVNSADTDLVLTVVGVVAGLVVGLVLRAVQATIHVLNVNARV
jgi:hypothetical protein